MQEFSFPLKWRLSDGSMEEMIYNLIGLRSPLNRHIERVYFQLWKGRRTFEKNVVNWDEVMFNVRKLNKNRWLSGVVKRRRETKNWRRTKQAWKGNRSWLAQISKRVQTPDRNRPSEQATQLYPIDSLYFQRSTVFSQLRGLDGMTALATTSLVTFGLI